MPAWVSEATADVAQAEELLVTAAAAYQVAFGSRLLAAYALGSLAHGGFSPLVSDVDLGLIVDDPIGRDDARVIEDIARVQKSSGKPLADRLSVFWGTPSTLTGRRAGGRFPPLDRLDLLENGRLLVGVEARKQLTPPGAEDLLVAGAEFALEFLAGVHRPNGGPQSGLASMRPASDSAVDEIRRPERLVEAGVRRLTKVVLFPVRFMFTAATGRVGTNRDGVRWYLAQEDAPSKQLVEAALGWRGVEPEDDESPLDLLRQQLLPLYLYYIHDHIARLDALGRVELRLAFMKWRDLLEA